MKQILTLIKLGVALVVLVLVSKVLGTNTDGPKEETGILGLDLGDSVDIAHAESSGCGGGDNSCGAGCGCGCSGPGCGPGGDPDGPGCCETGCACGCSSGADGSGDCFLTTVVVHRMGEADDGATLTAMRHLRDEFMLKNEEYAPMIAEYYEVAPPIAERLETAPMSEIEALYERILKTRSEVEQQNYTQAVRTYKQLVDDLCETV